MTASEERSWREKTSDLLPTGSNESIPISTTKILETFPKDAAPGKTSLEDEEAIQGRKRHHETAQKLRAWHTQQTGNDSAEKPRRMPSLRTSRTPRPPEAHVRACIDLHFPARMELTVTVCDFGPGRAERREVRLGDIKAGKFRCNDVAVHMVF